MQLGHTPDIQDTGLGALPARAPTGCRALGPQGDWGGVSFQKTLLLCMAASHAASQRTLKAF